MQLNCAHIQFLCQCFRYLHYFILQVFAIQIHKQKVMLKKEQKMKSNGFTVVYTKQIRIVCIVWTSSIQRWALLSIYKFKSLFLFGTLCFDTVCSLFSSSIIMGLYTVWVIHWYRCWYCATTVSVCASAFAYSFSHSFSLQSALWPTFKSVSSSNWLYPVGFSILVQRPSSSFYTFSNPISIFSVCYFFFLDKVFQIFARNFFKQKYSYLSWFFEKERKTRKNYFKLIDTVPKVFNDEVLKTERSGNFIIFQLEKSNSKTFTKQTD